MNDGTLFLARDGRLRASWRFAISLLLFLLANSLASLAVSPLERSHPFVALAVFVTVLTALLFGGFSAMLYGLDRVRSPLAAAMGVAPRKPWLRDSGRGILLGAGMVTVVVAAIGVLGDLSFAVGAMKPRLVGLVAVDLWILATGAMAEEMMFRGYPFQRLLEGIGDAGAVAVGALLFGVVHWQNPHPSFWGFLNTVLIGVLLSLAYLRTRSLWLPWGIHFGWNAMLGLALGLPVSGITDFAVLVRGTAAGPRWLTGGAYGIEASTVATGVIGMGIMLLVVLVRSRPAPTVVLAGSDGLLSLKDKANENPDPRVQ